MNSSGSRRRCRTETSAASRRRTAPAGQGARRIPTRIEIARDPLLVTPIKPASIPCPRRVSPARHRVGGACFVVRIGSRACEREISPLAPRAGLAPARSPATPRAAMASAGVGPISFFSPGRNLRRPRRARPGGRAGGDSSSQYAPPAELRVILRGGERMRTRGASPRLC